MPKRQVESFPPECPKEPLGVPRPNLSKHDLLKPDDSCPKRIDFDPYCDPDNPKTVLPRDVYKAALSIRQEMSPTPLVKSKRCAELGLEVYYKLEFLNRTHSYLERGAYYVLKKLKNVQLQDGIFTASIGDWGKALAFKARPYQVPVTVVLPEKTTADITHKIRALGATVVLHGRNLAEAKKHAFVLIHENECGTYIDGYDHPHVIAASGVIGMEILEQLPQVDAILVPIGGGGLIAGVASVLKQRKPDTLIYGIEPETCCSFFKAMANEQPYKTECGFSIAGTLAVPTVGFNAYHTAVSLIDKMVLTEDTWIAQAILHLAEVEKMVVDGAGAISLGALVARPNQLPELQGKTVVCVLTSSNMNNSKFCLALERAQEIEGRKVFLTIKLGSEEMAPRVKVLSVIASAGANILNMETEKLTFEESNANHIYLHLECETRDLHHACALKRLLTRLFPGKCEFQEEPFSPIPVCVCSPKKCVKLSSWR